MTTTAVTTFSSELGKRVRSSISDDMMAVAYRRLHRKAIVVMAWYAASYVMVLMASNWFVGSLACVSLALAMAAVGFNIQHDANHNAFFPTGGKRRLSMPNRIAGLSICLIGGSSKRWIDGHVNLHHVSPNVVGKDYDIVVPFARLAPAQPTRGFHAFQHFYVWVIYGFTAAGIIIGDIVNTVQESIGRDRKGKSPSAGEWASMVTSKGLFIGAMVVIPLLFHPWWIVLIGILVVLAITGFILGIVFQLAHVVEEADFSEVSDRAEVRWHEWQVMSSVDFCHGTGPAAQLVTWYIGGLNYQTEHHLFADLPHTLYPAIEPVVAETCAEFGIRHHVQPTLRAAIRSHYRHVRDLGSPPPRAEAA